MPILIPIALAALVSLYILERLLIAYSYRIPTMFNEKVNKKAIKIL